MTDLLERTPVQDVLLDERQPEPTVEPPPREERGVERPTAKRPVRWIRWMIGALVLIVAATVVTYALSSDGTTEVLDTDGSFQVAETQRMTRLAPTGGIDLDGSFQVVENQRLEALAPTGVTESDGSFLTNETRRLEALAPTSDPRLGPNQDLAPVWSIERSPVDATRGPNQDLAPLWDSGPPQGAVDLDGSFQANETRRMENLNPDS